MGRQDEAIRLLSEGGSTHDKKPFLDGVISFFGIIGIAALLAPILLTCADIAWRQIVGGSFIDTFDITKLCLVAAASWSIPYGFIHGTHVTVDLVADLLPSSAQRVLDAAIHLIAATLIALLAWLSWHGAMLHYGYGDTTLNLKIPVIYYWSIFLFGLFLTFVACLWRAWTAFRGKSTNQGALL